MRQIDSMQCSFSLASSILQYTQTFYQTTVYLSLENNLDF